MSHLQINYETRSILDLYLLAPRSVYESQVPNTNTTMKSNRPVFVAGIVLSSITLIVASSSPKRPTPLLHISIPILAIPPNENTTSNISDLLLLPPTHTSTLPPPSEFELPFQPPKRQIRCKNLTAPAGGPIPSLRPATSNGAIARNYPPDMLLDWIMLGFCTGFATELSSIAIRWVVSMLDTRNGSGEDE